MDIQNEFQKQNMKAKKLPEIKPGYTVRVHQKIKESGKERIQVYEGLTIAASGTKFRPMITVRRVVGGIGVERIFRLNAPNIVKIEVTKKEKVRRAKLYYIRRRQQKMKAREDKEGLKKVQEELENIQEKRGLKKKREKKIKKEEKPKSKQEKEAENLKREKKKEVAKEK